jgi:glycosyltransferase involved in cell wall biosynthesis
VSDSRAPARALFVGAFPPSGSRIVGGNVTACRALLASSFPARVRLELLDTTQLSNPPPKLAVRMAVAFARFLRFIERFERDKPEVVLLIAALGASLLEKGAMAWYARLRGVPSIMFPRGTSRNHGDRSSALARLRHRVMFGGVSRFICQGESWQRFATQELKVAVQDAPVIRNWTATDELLAIGANRVPSEARVVRLLFVGWLEREKGVFELIEALAHIPGTRGMTLDVVGDGRAAEAARRLVAERTLAGVVRFHGWLEPAAVRDALRQADVFVLPSWAEGLPNAMIEAMAAGLAVIVSRVGSIPDVVVDGESGLLVNPRDVDSLRQALVRIADDRPLRERLAKAAHRLAVREFSVETAVDRLVAQIDGARAVQGR